MPSLFILAVSALFVTFAVHANTDVMESFNFEVSMLQQSCHGDGREYMCSADPLQKAPVQLILHPSKAGPLEEQAFDGTSDEVGLNLTGNVGQYLSHVDVHKSVADHGRSVIYTLRFKTFQLLAGGQSVSYETIHVAEPPFVLDQPLALMGDRVAGRNGAVKQVSFNLRASNTTTPAEVRSQ